MQEPIRWQVEGSPHIHSIPSGALVQLQGLKGNVKVWINDKGEICIHLEGEYNCSEQREFTY